MADTREKLIELLYDSNVRCDQGIEHLADDIADVITKGVTVQKQDGCELCAKAKWIYGDVTASHPHEDGIAFTQIDGDFYFCPMCGRKLAEPPKGD